MYSGNTLKKQSKQTLKNDTTGYGGDDRNKRQCQKSVRDKLTQQVDAPTPMYDMMNGPLQKVEEEKMSILWRSRESRRMSFPFGARPRR